MHPNLRVSLREQALNKRSEVELEIDQTFFSDKIIPIIHKVMMSNVKIESKDFFNFVLGLRLALLYGSITIDENNFVLSQLVQLKEFWKWRNAKHSFIDPNAQVDTKLMKEIRTS